MPLIQFVDLQWHGDNRGSLVALESHKNIPFSIERVYYLFNTKEGVSRGFHAHRELKQLLIPVSGKCRIRLDNGTESEDVWLDNPQQGLLLDAMLWREMHDFSEDCVLLVLANTHYDESDYIRDYQAFQNECRS
ncbi:MAG: FdtA/QdtA family cupin domain-containing protein [Gammaproteobacteria bacterium]|nr:FdtA/QdtA family cupin domain-containing protein [Gammaproteobacteria bacterium]